MGWTWDGVGWDMVGRYGVRWAGEGVSLDWEAWARDGVCWDFVSWFRVGWTGEGDGLGPGGLGRGRGGMRIRMIAKMLGLT